MKDIIANHICKLEKEGLKYYIHFTKKTKEEIAVFTLRKKIVAQERLNDLLMVQIQESKIKIKELKAELLNEFYNKMDDYKNMNNNIIKSFNEFKNEYALIRKKFLELANFIKDIRFKKNLGIDVNKKEINKQNSVKDKKINGY